MRNHEPAADDWERHALQIAWALDTATTELAALIEQIRARRREQHKEGTQHDARPKP